MCFNICLSIDKLVQLTMSSITWGEMNGESVSFTLVNLQDRKYSRDLWGQYYALYYMKDELCACAYTHFNIWIDMYLGILKRKFLPSDPLFSRADEAGTTIKFGEKMTKNTFMETVNVLVTKCNIVPKNALGKELGKFTMHCFRRGGAHHRYITGKKRWPLDVFKWWEGWGKSDDINTIIRYLLEETSKYESNFTHFFIYRSLRWPTFQWTCPYSWWHR